MHPAEYCKHIGLKSLQHLLDISQQPMTTMQQWWIHKRHLFQIIAAGALVTERSSHKNPAMVKGMEVMKTADYHEDYGECLFFHFNNFEESPVVSIGSPECMDMESQGYWTHFIKDFDFNYLFEEAQRLNNEN